MAGLVFLAATRMEVAGFLDNASCSMHAGPGYEIFRGRNWDCLITGPGVFNTACALGAYLGAHTPSLVIDVGIAGVFDACGLEIGDLALADQEHYRHFGVGEDQPLPFALIPGHEQTASGIYPLDHGARAFCTSLLEAAFQHTLPSGPFLTVSAITESLDKADRLTSQTPYLMESMEGAAAAHVCQLYQIPLVEIRVGSNITGQRDKQLWDIPLACRKVAAVCTALSAESAGLEAFIKET